MREQRYLEHPAVRPVAVVTGATGGIGSEISLALARQGMHVCVLGRDSRRLAEIRDKVAKLSSASAFSVELTSECELHSLSSALAEQFSRVDVLIHCAGVFKQGSIKNARVEEFDLQYQVNVRAPYALTKLLLPLVIAARGQIVFLNSTIGLSAKRQDIGQYAATKHALKGIADSLREELNPHGVRVLSMYLGRTATPMQEAVHQHEHKAYHPERLVQPADVAAVVLNTLLLPSTVEVMDIALRPMQNPDAA